MPKKTKTKKIAIYADGGSRGNPGPSAIGVVLKDSNGKNVGEVSKFTGMGTNNVAEYMAVIFGLQEAVMMGAETVEINVDSQLVAKQLKGEYKVKDQNMLKFFGIAQNLLKAFKNITINHIPRDQNAEADALVNQALNLNALV